MTVNELGVVQTQPIDETHEAGAAKAITELAPALVPSRGTFLHLDDSQGHLLFQQMLHLLAATSGVSEVFERFGQQVFVRLDSETRRFVVGKLTDAELQLLWETVSTWREYELGFTVRIPADASPKIHLALLRAHEVEFDPEDEPT